jgi:hypothetical protein
MLWAGSTKITGRKISEMLGQGWRDAVHPDDLKHLDKQEPKLFALAPHMSMNIACAAPMALGIAFVGAQFLGAMRTEKLSDGMVW